MSDIMIVPPVADTPAKRMPTIYFIDDSATMREVIKIALRRENFNVITCADAASALSQFEQNRPDVVITDVIMPDQDGYAVCSQIKENPELSGIPVVLMSGVVNKSVADKAVSVKADELIRKPFQPQELIGRVKTLLGIKEPPPAAAPQTPKPSNVLQNVFGAPPAPPHAGGAYPNGGQLTGNSHAHNASQGPSTPAETAWPRALVEAFTPIMPPPGGNHSQPPRHAGAPVNAAPPANGTPTQSSPDAAKLRGEIVRMELLVKKLQTELQLEREYNQALEQQIRTLLASS